MQIDWTVIDKHDLPEPLREMACDVGLETVKFLVERWGGTVFYVPTLSKLVRRHIDDSIRKLYDGANEVELAREFGVTRSRVRRVINSKRIAGADQG